jgi:hypothetical protein
MILGLVLGLAACPVLAGDFFVYPTKGQSQEQQEKDKFECYQWAKQNTGFDPMQAPRTTTPAPPKEKKVSGAVESGVLGAAGGALIGALTGSAKKGALIGGGGGALLGGIRSSDQKKREKQRQQQWKQEQTTQYAENRNNYDRAYSACLEGRGYTVK